MTRWSCFTLSVAIVLLLPLAAIAQDPGSTPQPDSSGASSGAPEAAPADAPKPPSREAELAIKQSNISDKYARLEKLLFDLAALEAGENPARAALLRRAYEQSANQLTKKQMDTVVELITRSELRRATQEQQEVVKDLKTLLELLLSEDRPERLKNEQERYREYIREVQRILHKQTELHGQNEGGNDPKQLAEQQGKVSDRTQSLADKIRENEERSGNDQQNGTEDQKPGENNQQSGKQNGDQKPADDKTPEEPQPNPMSDEPGDKKPDPNEKPNENPGDRSPMPDEPSEQKPSDQKPSDQKPSDQKPSDQNPSDQKPSDQNPSDQQQSSDQQPSDQQQQTPSDQKSQNNPQQNNQQPSNQNQNQDQNQNQQQQQMENPARKQLEEAFKHMREAQQRLEEAKHKESLEEQEKAEADLLRTKALLEEILRQLREEEVGRTLELLESRFRKMLDLELRVYESTKRLDQVAEAERNRDFAIQANNLSGDQRKIALEADKALNLLEEEGSSLSFPEAVEQLRDEMYLVAERLAALKVSFVTQESEEAIIAELEELIDALQQAQQDLDQRKQQQQQQQQPSEPGEMPLVDQLAELKMIRALQMRVNTRTQRFARLLADIEDPIGQVTDAELREHIQQLSERELRIHELTRDLILGKNK